MKKWEVCIKTSAAYQEKALTYTIAWVAKLSIFFLKHYFYLKEEQTMAIKINILGRHVLENKVNLLFQGKQLTAFVAND